jgi:hypothetical protein
VRIQQHNLELQKVTDKARTLSVNAPGPSMNLNQKIMRPVGPTTSKNGIFISKFFYQYILYL